MPSSVLVCLLTMGKPKKVVKKRRFRGNQYRKTSCDVSLSEEPSTSRPRFEESDSSGESVDVDLDLEQSQPSSSASKRKIGDISGEDDWSDVGIGNIIVNVELLSKALATFWVCKYCKKEGLIDIFENIMSRKGLASNLSFSCKYCHESFSFYSSSKKI